MERDKLGALEVLDYEIKTNNRILKELNYIITNEHIMDSFNQKLRSDIIQVFSLVH